MSSYFNARGTEMNRLPAFGFAMAFFTVILWNSAIGSGITQSAYNLIESGGSALTMRTTINCGSGLTCVDNAGSNRTDISASGGGGGITALTQDVAASGSGSVAATVQGIDTVPLCGGYAPTNGQFLEYTTGGSPNPCYSSGAGGGSGTFSAAPPYFYDGTHYYVAWDGYQATKPTSSPTWINSVTPGTAGAGANGDYIFSGTGSYWAETAGTTSVEADFSAVGDAVGQTPDVGIWAWDSSNNIIYVCAARYPTQLTGSTNAYAAYTVMDSYSYNGSGNPAFSSTIFPSGTNQAIGTGGGNRWHFKLSKAASTLTCAISLDGGGNYTTLATHAVGTISDLGYTGGGGGEIVDIFSLVVN